MNFEKLDKKVADIQEAYQKGKAGIVKAIEEKNFESLSESMKVLRDVYLANPKLAKEALVELFEMIAEENPHLQIHHAPTDIEVWYEDKRILTVYDWEYYVRKPKLEKPTDTMEEMNQELAIRKKKLDKLNKELSFYREMEKTPEVIKDVAFRKEHGLITEESSMRERLRDWMDSRYVYRQLQKGEMDFIEHQLHELNRQQAYASREFHDLEDRIKRADEYEAERVRTKAVLDTLLQQYKIKSHEFMPLKRHGDKF